MTLTECTVEHATLEWFGELGYAVCHGHHLAPHAPAAEPYWFGRALLAGCVHEPAVADAGEP